MIKGDWILIAFHWATLKYNMPVTRFSVGDSLRPKNSALHGPLVKERDIASQGLPLFLAGTESQNKFLCVYGGTEIREGTVQIIRPVQ